MACPDGSEGKTQFKNVSFLLFQQYIYNLKVDKIIVMITGSGSGIDLKAKPVA